MENIKIIDKKRLVKYWIQDNIIKDKKIINTFKKISRENFVLDEYKNQVYLDKALPILKGQTISQPTTVMIMLDNLEVRPNSKILEIGTGSGYLLALLSQLVNKKNIVYSTEVYDDLIKFAKNNLEKEKIRNISIHKSKELGLKEYGLFDRIIVSAATNTIPLELLNQLKKNGILIIPVGNSFFQRLLKIIKKEKTYEKKDLGAFSFVFLK